MVKILQKPFLLQGKIMHKRLFHKVNEFNYEALYISFPINKKNLLKKLLFSINKFNLFSFSDKIYGDKTNNNKLWIENIFKENQLDKIKNIILVTQPKILGYVFNPVSFWLGFDEKENLIAVLAEVSNTFSQKHCYLLYNENQQRIKPNQWLEAQKLFHVSPFFSVEGKYKFRFVISDKKMDFYINYYKNEKLALCTYLKCKTRIFSDKNLLFYFLKNPHAIFKTIFLIHFQALKLFLKKVKFHKLPPKLANSLTISKQEK